MFMDNVKKMLVVLIAAGSIATLRAADAPPGTNAAKPAVKSADLFPDTLVAKGKGVEVKRSQLDDELVSIKSAAAARGQMLPPDRMAMIERQVLDRMIQLQLVLGQATDADKAKGKADANKMFEQERTNAPSEESFVTQLKAMGLTTNDVLRKMADESTAEAVVERELKSEPTADDLKKFYDDNTSAFEAPEMVRASHVLLSTRDMATGVELTSEKKAAKLKLAQDLVKRARAGEDFAKLAKEYSEDPGSKNKGGEYTFPRGKMVPEFEATAFSLKTNEVSDVVTTQFGYHIIKLSEKIPAKKEPFAGAATKTVFNKRDGQPVTLGDAASSQAMQKKVPEYMAKLRKSANIEILDARLKDNTDSDLPAGGSTPKPDNK
jgi:peptidyl-prolyl cis-trans isomerase C